MSNDNKKKNGDSSKNSKGKIGFGSIGCAYSKIGKNFGFNGGTNFDTGDFFSKRSRDFANRDENSTDNRSAGSANCSGGAGKDISRSGDTGGSERGSHFRRFQLNREAYSYNRNNSVGSRGNTYHNNGSDGSDNGYSNNTGGGRVGGYFRRNDVNRCSGAGDAGGDRFGRNNYSNRFGRDDRLSGGSFNRENGVSGNNSFRRNTNSYGVRGDSGSFFRRNSTNSGTTGGDVKSGDYSRRFIAGEGAKTGFGNSRDGDRRSSGGNSFHRRSNAVKVKINRRDDDGKRQTIKKTTNTGGNVDKYSINSMIKGLSSNIELDTEIDDVLGNVISVKLSGISSSNSLQKEKKVRTSSRSSSDRKATFNTPIIREISVYNDAISLASLADQMAITVKELVRVLAREGVEIGASDFKLAGSEIIDGDTAELIAESFGHRVVRRSDADDENEFVKSVTENHKDIHSRAPIVTIMGHVDHGKTTLLDTIRRSSVVAGEAGGITQHIGAYRTKVGNRWITFLDTPGHAAFTQMRMRGANVTDVVVIVVAADDGIMPQTEEAISHAKVAGVPIVVAINKIDKQDANIEKTKQMLLKYELVPEELGGDVTVVPISAKEGKNVDKLLEAILLRADLLELKAYYDGDSNGVVIESKLDKKRGALVTVIVENGILSQGDFIIAGEQYGKVKGMFDENGKMLKTVEPSMPAEILGLNATPNSGEKFYAVKDEKSAKRIVEQRIENAKKENQRSKKSLSVDDVLLKMNSSNTPKKVSVVIKADTKGSLEAIVDTLEKRKSDEIELSILHTGIGSVSESDVLLASTCDGMIFTFNTQKCDKKVNELAERNDIEIRDYKIIYELFDDIETIMSDKLKPTVKKNILGHAEVKAIFEISKVGKIAGCIVKDGVISRSAVVGVMRGGEVVFETRCTSLKREKENVKDVQSGKECGIGLERIDDVAVGDVLEFYTVK